MGFWDFFWESGRDPSFSKVSNYTPQQQKLLNSDIRQARRLQRGGYNDAMSLLQQYLDPQSDVYQNFEAPYMQQFEQQVVPGLAERFAGLGAMGGGLSSSGFGQALGAAGANLQTQLASMKEQYRRQAINDLLGQYNQLTNRGLNARSFENTYDPGTQGQLGFGGELIKGGISAAAAAYGGPAAKQGVDAIFDYGVNMANSGTGGYPGGSGYKDGFGKFDINFGQRY